MINRTVLQGRLTKDPALNTTSNGVEVCNFTVAWSEKYKETETTCFLNCVAWRQTGAFVKQYFSKGKEIGVEGQLVTRTYTDRDGNNRSTTELVCDKVHFCGKKSDGGGQAMAAHTEANASGFVDAGDDDGDLPF